MHDPTLPHAPHDTSDDDEHMLEIVGDGWREFARQQPQAARAVATLLAAKAAELDVELQTEPPIVVVRLKYRDGRGTVELFHSRPALDS
jgi:hypothetical protein